MLEEYLTRVRDRAPLVQCITNFVTVNDCANVLLAAGASPTMAHCREEAAEVTEHCQALVLNLGAVEWREAMLLAGRRANELGIPVVLDPVGVGTTSLRRRTAAELLDQVKFAVIRGNASEIRALALGSAGGSGVDVSAADAVTEENLPRAAELVRILARRTGAAAALSGVIDVIGDGTRTAVLRNGCASMARITGSGCMLAALTGAFCAAAPEEPFLAAAAAAAVMDRAGELAEARRLKNGTGTATFRTDFIDAVSNLTPEQLKEGLRCEIYQR